MVKLKELIKKDGIESVNEAKFAVTIDLGKALGGHAEVVVDAGSKGAAITMVAKNLKQGRNAVKGVRKIQPSVAKKVSEETLNEASYVKGKMMTLIKKDFKVVHDGLVGNVFDSPDLTNDEKYARTKFRKMMDTARSNYVNAVMKATKPFDKKITGR